MTYALRQNCREKSQLISDLKDFDLDRLICTSEFDRGFILTAIDTWYGNREAFRDFVRGPLRDELLGFFPSPMLPYEYMALIFLSSIAWLLESVLALCEGGAESHQLVIWLVSYAACICWVGSCISGLFFLSDKTSQSGGSCFIDLAKTLGVAAGINMWALLGLAWLLPTVRSENTLAIVCYVAFSALIPLIPCLTICRRRVSNRRWSKQNAIWSTEKGFVADSIRCATHPTSSKHIQRSAMFSIHVSMFLPANEVFVPSSSALGSSFVSPCPRFGKLRTAALSICSANSRQAWWILREIQLFKVL